MDNFSGHKIQYKPQNIHIECFEPNMPSFVQLLDSGIIWCFKAHYWKAFCLCALNLDEAGSDDIYKINLLEVMLLAKAAWDAVSAETIANCWNHSGIQNYWWVMKRFMESSISHKIAAIQEHLPCQPNHLFRIQKHGWLSRILYMEFTTQCQIQSRSFAGTSAINM